MFRPGLFLTFWVISDFSDSSFCFCFFLFWGCFFFALPLIKSLMGVMEVCVTSFDIFFCFCRAGVMCAYLQGGLHFMFWTDF